MEFIRGLLQEVVKKIQFELNPVHHPDSKCIIDDNYLMSHLIDEILVFDREVRAIHGYPSQYPGAINVLLEEGPLCRWINLEKQCRYNALHVLWSTAVLLHA